MLRFRYFGVAMLLLCVQFLYANDFDVKNYGAKGDGKTLDTDAINKAIEAANAAGGGRVFFPAGTYLSYSIHLKSNVTLYLEQGSVLLAAEPNGDVGYDAPEDLGAGNEYQDFGHSHWHNSLIWGENLNNIAILGQGMIYGKGLSRNKPYKAPVGNKSIALKLCKNVTIKDITIFYGGHFGILATGVDNLTIDNVKMDTNRDGMDIDCCQNVRISNCDVNSPWDDAICLKASFALGYARATQNVVITNCIVSGYDIGTFLDGTYKREKYDAVPDGKGPTGRIKFGTESNGDFKNITISNCVFDYCRGLALETVDGSNLEDVTISNITMRDVVNAPIFLRLGARMRGPENVPVGHLRRVIISNVVAYNTDSRFSSLITGLPNHDIEDVQFNNIKIYYKALPYHSVIPDTVPELTKIYPEPQTFGLIPAYGFYIRHAQNIEMNNVSVSFLGNEVRPAMSLVDVKGIALNNFKAQRSDSKSTLILNKVSGFISRDGNIIPETKIAQTKFKTF